MRREALASLSADLVRAFHQAFIVEAFGADAGLISPDDLQMLLERGILDPSAMGEIRLEAGTFQIDPFLFLRAAGRAMFDMSPADLHAARLWGVDDWAPVVAATLPDLMVQGGLQVGGGAGVGAPPLASISPPLPQLQADIRPPSPAQKAPQADAGGDGGAGDGGGDLPPPEEAHSPRWLAPQERIAHSEALSRAGDFARGLGNAFAADIREATLEGWEGEQIVEEVDPEARERMRRIIREETASSIVGERDARKLARDLADRTGYYSHNWDRIASTELQGAHNAGRVGDALHRFGPGARIARITESGACRHCLRLFTGPDGAPKVFSADELMSNGSNVGLKPDDWKATIWPVHPNCRCDTLPVPEGMAVAPDGRLVKPKTPSSP